MKKNFKLLFVITTLIWTSCSENTNTNTINGSEPNTENSPTLPEPENDPEPTTNETSSEPVKATVKTDAEVILEGGELLLNVTLNVVERKRIRDSIYSANKEKMYAFQIGMKMKDDEDAKEMYEKLTNAGMSSLYIFKVGRKEYYIVKFEAKGVDELESLKDSFKTELSGYTTEGFKIVNLTGEDFCSKRRTVVKCRQKDIGREINCLTCD